MFSDRPTCDDCMTNKLKCEYYEGSTEQMISKHDAGSATSARSQEKETGLTVSSDPNEAPSRRHDAAIERAITGEDPACP